MITFSQFKHAVRRYAPSDLLPALAARSSQIAVKRLYTNDLTTEEQQRILAYGTIARISMLHGNEFRSSTVDESAIIKLVNLFWEAEDAAHDPEINIWALVSAFMYEQFALQGTSRDELIRSYLMLCETSVEAQLVKPNTEDWKELLGASIHDAFSAAFMFYVVAINHNGEIDDKFIESDAYKRLEDGVPRESAYKTLELLTASIAEIKIDAAAAAERSQVPTSLERFSYNPLSRTPVIELEPGRRLAPQPEFILHTMSPENLYYRGMRQWADQEFGKAYGARVEAYTGMQLLHSGKFTVEGEFKYQKSGSEARSSDWFLMTPQATFIIECKSARMSLIAKAGSQSFPKVFEEHITKAYRQLDENAKQITSGNKSFAHIPADKPLIGLVVAAEPLYSVNDPSIRELLPQTKIPILTLTLRDIEMISTLDPEDAGRALSSIANDATEAGWNISAAVLTQLGMKDYPKNRLMEEAFDRVFLPTVD
ncbi:hypothetical protein CQ020_11320 [Arthrobacter sp. MYb23]|uniref:hypothetical protein n=1 Tax=unclassified Arthrobacter TaxID=235627 RepID=UPI000CFDDB4C|nr:MULTISPECIES: hypothetical protein [unclassified Arthrobacter]PRB41576.1 hypothetical protein CQ038_12455 [Arthrobacter sp. MYb51]PRB96073.1 hypothetical protein CQ020_11320 [Arthrobacter sp. MYb23]